jgi:hypothetical protein
VSTTGATRSRREISPVNDTTGQRRGNPLTAARSSRTVSRASRLWSLFWVLVLLQAVDLATTYFAVRTAGAREGNPVLRDLMFTAGIPVLKGLALVFLAWLILRSANSGRPAPGRLLVAVQVTVLLYLAIVVNNVTVILGLR